ncbi:MAG TPA: galactose oxidase-like domain-containing protein [Solirubrobacteraceae bacterium]
MSTPSSGFFGQSNWGAKGNFEVVSPLAAGGLVHVSLNNDAAPPQWSAPSYFGAGFADDVAIKQTSYGSPGNIDAIARFGDRLVHYYRSADLIWHTVGQIASGINGTPSLIESTSGRSPANPHGNFELVAPAVGGGLVHWWRDNTTPAGQWHGPNPFGVGSVLAVALLQSNFSSPGDLEVIALQGGQLVHYWRDAHSQWHGPSAQFGAGVHGGVAAIQSTFGTKGNFEVVAPLAAGGLGYWWRDNDAGQTWHGPTNFAGGTVDAVSLIQSSFTDAGGGPGHLEVVTRSGHLLEHWWRASGGAQQWVDAGPAFQEVPCLPSTSGDNKLPYESEIVGIHMALLNTGKLLLFAFGDMNETVGVSRVIEPNTGLISTPAATPNVFCSGHVHLGDGRVVVVGGHHMAMDITGYRRFDPHAETWQPLGNMQHGRWYPTCTALPDGRVFVISGTVAGGPVDPTKPLNGINNTVQIFDPVTSTMGAEQAIPLPFSTVDSFQPVDLYPYCYVLPSGRVFVHSRRTTRFYDPATQSWDTTELHANYQWSRTYPGGGTSVLLPLLPTTSPPYRARVLITGGGGADPTLLKVNTPATATAEILDLSAPAPAWRTVAAPMLSPRVMPDSVLLPDGMVLVAGGSAAGRADHMLAPVYQLELFDPTTETWTSLCSIHVPRLYHSTAILLPDARVLMAGRSGLFQDAPYNFAEHRIEIFSPPYLSRGPRPVITGAPSSAGYGETITVNSPQAANIDAVALIRTGSVTHGLNMDQRFVGLSITGRTANSLTVTMPPDDNVAPPGEYLLFVLVNGVPSVAPFIRLGGRTSLVWGTNGADANQPLFEAQGLALQGKLYVFGGFDTGHPILTTPQAHAYDPSQNQWTRLADVPVKLTHAGQASDGNTIYLAGGFEGDNPGGSSKKVWKYDITNNSWAPGPSLPADRGGGVLVRVGRKLHYFGGGHRAPGGVITQDFGDHWALDLNSAGATWTGLAPMPNPRNHMGGCVLNGNIYAIGGQHLANEGHCQVSVDVYDSAANRWTSAANLPQPRGHVTANVLTRKHRILVISGITNTSVPMANITEYDPATNSWTELTPLPGPRQSPVSGIIGNQLIVAGGSLHIQTWIATLSP